MTRVQHDCRIELHEGARLQQSSAAYTLLGHATVIATPVKNERGMTSGYRFSYHGRDTYVSGAHVTWLADMPAFTLDGVIGLVKRTTSVVGSTVELHYVPDCDLFDPMGGDWVTTCETHHTLCNHRTRRLAESHLRCADWCDACMRGE